MFNWVLERGCEGNLSDDMLIHVDRYCESKAFCKFVQNVTSYNTDFVFFLPILKTKPKCCIVLINRSKSFTLIFGFTLIGIC